MQGHYLKDTHKSLLKQPLTDNEIKPPIFEIDNTNALFRSKKLRKKVRRKKNEKEKKGETLLLSLVWIREKIQEKKPFQ